jgi:predicted O-methyltransferase YrrM
MRAIVWALLASALGHAGCEAPSHDAAPAAASPGPAKPTEPGPKDASVLPDPGYVPKPGAYHFSKDMFTGRIPVWTEVFGELKGKPDLHYLEVGVFEGRSVVWMLENVLTHPSTRVTAVDIFPEGLAETFRANMRLTGRADDVTILEGPSGDVLRTLPARTFDVVYIDGSHTADDVLADAVLAWGLMKVGGVLVFDDFLWVGRGENELLPVELRPSLAVASFITAYRNEIEVLRNDYQVILRKVANACTSKHYCSPLGRRHVYLWRDKALVSLESGETVALGAEARAEVERLATARRFGEAGWPAEARTSDVVKAIGLDLPAAVNPLSEEDRGALLGVGDPVASTAHARDPALSGTGTGTGTAPLGDR